MRTMRNGSATGSFRGCGEAGKPAFARGADGDFGCDLTGAAARLTSGFRKGVARAMSHAVAELLTILDLERIEENIFRGRSPQVGWQRVFGGLVVAQALVASARTVEGRAPHSLHGYFLLPGDPAVPIVYEVDRIRDGKSFTTRRCNAIQHGRAIFSLSASFQIEEPGSNTLSQCPMFRRRRACRAKPKWCGDMARPCRKRSAAGSPGSPIEARPVDPSRYVGHEAGRH